MPKNGELKRPMKQREKKQLDVKQRQA
jgi:hypothetical protein